MGSHVQWLKYLLYLDLSAAHPFDFATEHCQAMRSGSSVNFCNRVMADSAVAAEEIDTVVAFFGKTPFRWFVDEQDTEQIAKLEQQGLRYTGYHPAMQCDITQLEDKPYHPDMVIKEVTSQEEFNLWLAVAARGMEIAVQEKQLFMAHILRYGTSGSVHLYLAFYQGIPAATSMVIQRGAMASLHSVTTLPEYRGKGIGYAISHKPLVAMKNLGATTAILLASDMGKPVYEKIGFTVYAVYKKYEKLMRE